MGDVMPLPTLLLRPEGNPREDCTDFMFMFMFVLLFMFMSMIISIFIFHSPVPCLFCV
jgi:hypothetical protein